MKRILAATDFSTRADAAVRRAGLLAMEHGAEVVLCHVVEEDQPETLLEADRRKAKAALDDLVRTIPELDGVSCRLAVESASPFEGIIRTAQATEADLIVIGPHRRNLLREVFVGTTAERVMRLGTLPVLMVNREPSRPYQSVLAAVDLSDWSAHAVNTARRLGLLDGAQLTIVHAFDAGGSGLATAGVPKPVLQENISDAAAAARRDFDAFVTTLDIDGVETGTRLWEGPPVRAILEAVVNLHPDLVVIGTRGQTGFAKLLLGSVADELLRELGRDVLAVAAKRPG